MESSVTDGQSRCTPCQRRAIAHIRKRAGDEREAARARLWSILQRAGLSEDVLRAAMHGLRGRAQVVLHFHPDRITNDGRTVAEGLLADGLYRSQFETGISNGSPTAFPGGERDSWERELFGGAYHSEEVRDEERPKYGSLQVFHYSDGPSPRFGSCYFVLNPSVSNRATFTYGDSHTKPSTAGTSDELGGIMLALLEDVEKDGEALGSSGLTLPRVLRYLVEREGAGDPDPLRRPVGRVLDDYIEAQVHGPIDLSLDVESLVADPSFVGTETGHHLQEMCSRYDIALRWHHGFELPVHLVPADFRGPVMIPLARRIAEVARADRLDAATIGIAAAHLYRAPDRWSEWGAYTEVLRRFRQIWHVLVRFGTARNG